MGVKIVTFINLNIQQQWLSMGKNDPQNNLECKFVHQNQNLCIMDPLTPHNTTPGPGYHLGRWGWEGHIRVSSKFFALRSVEFQSFFTPCPLPSPSQIERVLFQLLAPGAITSGYPTGHKKQLCMILYCWK